MRVAGLHSRGGVATSPDMRTYTKPDADTLRKQLSPMQFHVTQHDATEPPFQNQYWDNHAEGLYVDITTGEPLFFSFDKFESGTGWPSFTRPANAGCVQVKEDKQHGMVRVEVRSNVGNAHLGHVFPDGPKPTGMRFCINSASLRFIAVSDLATQGYGEFSARFGVSLPPPPHTDNACAVPKTVTGDSCESTVETVVLAGGCFWGMEDILREVPGVLDTDVGYAGGNLANPTYEFVKRGNTGHAEAIRVVFDPSILPFERLLEDWFFKMHDPTTKNRQGNDMGSQYRSAIFFGTEAQRETAERIKEKVNQSGAWKHPIVTEVVQAGEFTAAEGYHQDYLEKNPGGYTCHFMRR